MAIDKLIIHKLTFDLEIGTKEEYKRYADRLSNLCKNRLPRRLESILKDHDLPQGRLVIHKLDINLGRINPHFFETTVLNSICKKIASYLTKHRTEIELELQQAIFKTSSGRKITLSKSDFVFESELFIEKSVDLNVELAQPIILPSHAKEDRSTTTNNTKPVVSSIQSTDKSKIPVITKQSEKIAPTIEIPQTTDSKESPTSKKALPEKKGTTKEIINQEIKEAKKEKARKEKSDDKVSTAKKMISDLISTSDVTHIEEVQDKTVKVADSAVPSRILPPKQLTPLDKTFLYYLQYGRLPSNVKYELGNSMLDVFNISKTDERFFEDISRQIQNNPKAKDRLIRLMDDKNKSNLIQKNVITKSDTEEFDPKIPKSFEDYTTALLHDLDTDHFSAALKRYSLNDMIRFIYADSPQKLRALFRYLIMNFPTEKDVDEIVDLLFNRISKPSVVKLLSAFVRKGGYFNRALNALNKAEGKDIKKNHKIVFKQLLAGKMPNLDDFDVKPRIFLSTEPRYETKELDYPEILDYYLNYGSLPLSLDPSITIRKIDAAIFSLSAHELKNLAFFTKNKTLQYQSFGKISVDAILHIVKAIDSNISEEIKTKFHYFKYNIETGVPLEFQKSFMVHYARMSTRKSYLEEMLIFWKAQFGDSDLVIKQRWKVKEELEKELSKLIRMKEQPLAKELKVDQKFVDYSKDISVKNAGLVILWPFLKIYFNMLDLLNPQGNFNSIEERARACHLLQYLAVERSEGEEFYYPLNKILTGYPLEEPLPYQIKMTEKEIDVSNALLKNVLKQWNALSGGTVEGLRGSFLIRDGVLTVAKGGGWLLTVEKRAYDILMDKMPWGIGMIKLSWAPYVLNVEWERNIM